jgi:molybdopterin molybdotransferase
MPEFLTLLPPTEALNIFFSRLDPKPILESVPAAQALGRVTAEPITAPHPLPDFPRSTVDGYAVKAGDTFGASASLPAYLDLIGEVPMGGSPSFTLSKTQCATIHTGGMLPDGADSVVMIEETQSIREGEVEILKAVGVGENVIKVGEDVLTGDEVIPTGKRLRPAEIGGLMALGVTNLKVNRQPRVAILSSGDEVVPPERTPEPGQVRDVNSFTLSALVTQAGGIPKLYGIIADTRQAMLAAAREAWEKSDLVVITAGSSASTRDLTAEVIDQLGEPGVLVHGVNVRPGKPTILAVCDGVPMIGLPGNPVSALVIAGLFVLPVIRALQGETYAQLRPMVLATLELNLASQAGREEWVPVRLLPGEHGLHADPVFGKSNLIFTLSKADGLVRIAPDATGLAAGTQVEVLLF